MKFNWNKRYTTYAIYAAIVSAALIFCIFLGVYIKSVWAAVLHVIDVLAPLIYGLIIAYILNPLLKIFEKSIFRKIKHRMLRRGLGVTLTYLVFLSALSLLVYAVVPQLGRSFSDLQSNLAVYSQSLKEWMSNVSQQSGFLANIVNWLSGFIDFSFLNAPLANLIQLAYDLVSKFSPYIMDFFGSFVVQLKNIIIGLVFAGYLLCSKELLFAQVNKLLHVFCKKERLESLKRNVAYADKTFGKYLMGTFLDALIVGCVTALGMFVLSFITGMPRQYIALVSVIIACTNIIPIFGPFIGGIPSAVIIFIADPINALWFAIMIVVIQQIDGNFIAPRILGSTTGLPALYVIIAITVVGGLFGIPGMIIAVPLFAIIGNIISKKTGKRIREKQLALTVDGQTTPDGYTREDYEGFDEFDDYNARPEETDNGDLALEERFGGDDDTDGEDSEVNE